MKILNKLKLIIFLLIFLIKNLLNKLLGRKNLVVSIRLFSEYGYSEAVNKQGIDFCCRLEKEKISYICISMDGCYELMRHKNINVMCVKSQMFGLLVRLLNPDSILLFNSCLVDLFPYEEVYSQFCSLFVLTSNQPAINIAKNNFNLVNMIHLHDYGRLSLLCHSTEAQTNLQMYGFLSTVYELPFIDVTSISNKLKVSKKLKRIGFASSPLQSNDYISKGCEFLFEESRHCNEYSFDVLWRDENVPFSGAVPKNVSMVFGKTNMSDFYQKIDCVVLPYVGKVNHSFPLSCLEAILLSIPVVVSNRCGCRDYIERHGFGVLFDVEPKKLCLSLKNLSVNYTDFVSNLLNFKDSILEDVEHSYRKMIDMLNNFNVEREIIDLRKWKKELEMHNKELIIGAENLSNYYKKSQVATGYDEERFVSAPQDMLSRQEVDFVNQACLRLDSRKILLDAACGTGRFYPVYDLFEKTLMLDASAEMSKVCQNSSWFNPQSTQFYISDLLAFESDTKFDAIICFRLLRHFQAYERKRFFEKISELLLPGGCFIFDVPLLQPELTIRESEGWHNYNIYDYFWDISTLENEISSSGFFIRDIYCLGQEMVKSNKYKYFEMCCAIQKN